MQAIGNIWNSKIVEETSLTKNMFQREESALLRNMKTAFAKAFSEGNFEIGNLVLTDSEYFQAIYDVFVAGIFVGHVEDTSCGTEFGLRVNAEMFGNWHFYDGVSDSIYNGYRDKVALQIRSITRAKILALLNDDGGTKKAYDPNMEV